MHRQRIRTNPPIQIRTQIPLAEVREADVDVLFLCCPHSRRRLRRLRGLPQTCARACRARVTEELLRYFNLRQALRAGGGDALRRLASSLYRTALLWAARGGGGSGLLGLADRKRARFRRGSSLDERCAASLPPRRLGLAGARDIRATPCSGSSCATLTDASSTRDRPRAWHGSRAVGGKAQPPRRVGRSTCIARLAPTLASQASLTCAVAIPRCPSKSSGLASRAASSVSASAGSSSSAASSSILAAPSRRLVVEIDGGYHARIAAKDARRDRALARAGWRVLRIDAALVMADIEAAVALVRSALEPPG